MLIEELYNALPSNNFYVDSSISGGKFISLRSGKIIIKIEYYNEHSDIFCSIWREKKLLFSEKVKSIENLTKVFNEYIK